MDYHQLVTPAGPAEWLLTNGTGSYAMGSCDRIPRRRYHGLYTAALHPPRDRHLILSLLVLELKVNQKTYPLWSAYWERDHRGPEISALLSFHLQSGIPTYRWDAGPVTLIEQIYLIPRWHGTIIQYEWQAPQGADLKIVPLFRGQNHHHLGAIEPEKIWATNQSATLAWPHSTWQLDMPGAQFRRQPEWYYHVYYPEEAERGYEAQEDLWTPGSFHYHMAAGHGRAWWVLHKNQVPPAVSFSHLTTQEMARRQSLSPNQRAAEVFVAEKGHGARAIIAGYPWFSDWNRDTFIAAPGINQALDDPTFLDGVLSPFLDHEADAMGDHWDEESCAPQGQSLDAGLWFIVSTSHALLGRHLKDDRAYLEVIDHFLARYLKVMDAADGLLFQPASPGPSTWMDAIIQGQAVTPRYGKPIEIQSLWYNAVKLRDELAQSLGQSPRYNTLSQTIRASVNRYYARSEGGFRDNLGTDDADTLRPNQIYAVGLPHPLAQKRYWPGIVEAVLAHLYRPYGLLTLSPDDPHFHDHYGPGLVARDQAYHQGMAWPYLLGVFLDAEGRVNPPLKDALTEQIRGWAKMHQRQAGLGSISEILDPNTARPQGTPFQAWSVAELIRSGVLNES